MSDFILSPNMNMPVPIVGVEIGPNYANDLNNSLSILDQHNHTAGSGVQIPVDGINIASDFPINGNNLNVVKSVRFQSQGATLSGPSDLGSIYRVGLDLYYNNGNGAAIQITTGTSLSAVVTSVAGLTYSGSTFTFQRVVPPAAANTPAFLDAGSVTIRNGTVAANGVTLDCPAALATSYNIVLPLLPTGVTKFVRMDVSGNQAADVSLDNTTVELNGSNQVQVKAASIGLTQLAPNLALVPPGTVLPYVAATAPAGGFLLCDGTSYLRTTYAALFAVIGTAYGAADATHFNVPDMTGMFMRGWGAGSTYDPDAASRVAANPGGNTGNNIGSIQPDIFEAHTHTTAIYDDAGANGPGVRDSAITSPNGNATTALTGGNETRPINLYFNYIIKT